MDSITVQAGERLELLIPVLDATGAPVDIAGWSGRSQVRAGWRSDTLLHEWTSTGEAPNADIVSGTGGGVRLTATPTETDGWLDAWPGGRRTFDVIVTDLDGEPHVLGPWALRLLPRITRQETTP